LDFGFWILVFGIWNLDFDFDYLDLGIWDLGFILPEVWPNYSLPKLPAYSSY